MSMNEIILVIFVITVVIGVLLGLYLAKYCEPADDEEYEMEAYLDEKYKQNK